MKLLLGSFILFIIVGCWPSSMTSKYQETLDANVPKELHDHFPKKIGSNDFELFFMSSPESGEVTSNLVTFYLSYEPQRFDSLNKAIKEVSLAKYEKFNNDCNVVLYKFQKGTINTGIKGREWLYNDWIKSLDSCNENRLPIPNFVDAGLDIKNNFC